MRQFFYLYVMTVFVFFSYIYMCICVCVSLGFIYIAGCIYASIGVAKFCGCRKCCLWSCNCLLRFITFPFPLMFLRQIYKMRLLYRRNEVWRSHNCPIARRCHCVYIRFPWVLKGSVPKSLIALNVNMRCLSSEQTNKIYLRYYVI